MNFVVRWVWLILGLFRGLLYNGFILQGLSFVELLISGRLIGLFVNLREDQKYLCAVGM